MGKHDDNYTFELRPLGTRRPYNDFVIMKKGGEAHQSYINVLEDHLEERFKVHRERVRILYDLARAGCAVRYYMEEGRVSALFPAEKWHIEHEG